MFMALPVKLKVLAYVTHGNRLLVFRQPNFPEAGIQVPGGSVHSGESLNGAVMREAVEETGLSGLRPGSYLGDVKQDHSSRGRFEIHHRHYYHLTTEGDVPEVWQHTELDPSEGDYDSVLFELFWVELPDGVPPLISEMDQKIPELLVALGFG
jgi:8-oxo-dGTP pyrophosphatase MutT (NUDIX family)